MAPHDVKYTRILFLSGGWQFSTKSEASLRYPFPKPIADQGQSHLNPGRGDSLSISSQTFSFYNNNKPQDLQAQATFWVDCPPPHPPH